MMIMRKRSTEWLLSTSKMSAATFIIKATNDIVDVVWEEPSVVEYRGQHSRNGTRWHDDTVFMLVHLSHNNRHTYTS